MTTNTGSITARRTAHLFEKRPCMVPAFVLDKMADEQMHGGYRGKRHATCPGCHTKRSANGTCFCD